MKSLFTLLFVFSSIIISAQSYFGRIVDKQGQPMTFATIEVYHQIDSTFIIGAISDENGLFTIEIDEKDIYLEFSFIGFESKKLVPTQVNLGDITLNEEGKFIDAITVTARRNIFQQKTDRLVYNVENAIVGSGGTALDVLGDTPNVTIDNEDIKIIGKGTVKVMIDDRMVRLSRTELSTYLSSIPSDDIKKVEVITAPPAKYDAEGNSGLINIQLKKVKANNWNNQIRVSYLQTTYPAVTFGNTFNYSKNKLSLIASITATKGERRKTNDINFYYPDEPWKSHLITRMKQDNFSGRLGVDYKTSPMSTIGFVYTESGSNNDTKDKGETIIGSSFTNRLENQGNNDYFNQNRTVNIHFLQKLDTIGKKLSIDLDYFNSQKKSDGIFTTERFGDVSSFFQVNNLNAQRIQNYSARIDMEHPTKWAMLTYGAKTTVSKIKSDIKYYDQSTGGSIFDPNRSDIFSYEEKINSLYTDINKSIGKKWQVKLGFRLENTSTTGFSESKKETNQNNYSRLFPTTYVTYYLNSSNQFNFSYSRRIRRPGYGTLNPFRFYINQYNYQEGNPFLKPQITDNIELQHTFKGLLISKVFFSYLNNVFSNYGNLDKQSKLYVTTYENFYTSYNYGISEILRFNPTSWWNTILQTSLSTEIASYIKGLELDQEILSGFNFRISNKNTFSLNNKKTLHLETNAIYLTPQTGSFYETEDVLVLNFGVKMSFFDKKLQCTLMARDLLNQASYDVFVTSNGVKQLFNTNFDSRNFRLSLSYRFGNDNINLTARKAGNRSEQNRAD